MTTISKADLARWLLQLPAPPQLLFHNLWMGFWIAKLVDGRCRVRAVWTH